MEEDRDSSYEEEEEEDDDERQAFKEKYLSALAEGCEKSSSSSNESLRRDCPELYNQYRAKVMGRLECLDGVTTQVQLDRFSNVRPTLTIRELDDDETSPIDQSSSNCTDVSIGQLSSNSIDELDGRVSSDSVAESNGPNSPASSDSVESNGPTSSESNSSVESETERNTADGVRSTCVEIGERKYSNHIALAFEENSPDSVTPLVLEGKSDRLKSDRLKSDRLKRDSFKSDIPLVCQETVTWRLPGYARSTNESSGCLSGSLNTDPDYALMGNENMVEHISNHLSSSRNKAGGNKDVTESLPGCSMTVNEETAGDLSSPLNADYALMANENMVEHMSKHLASSRKSSGRRKPASDHSALSGNKARDESLSSSLNAVGDYAKMRNEKTDLSGLRDGAEGFKSVNGYAVMGNKEMAGDFSLNVEADSFMAGNDKLASGHLSSSRSSAERYKPMQDYALQGNEEIGGGLSSLLKADGDFVLSGNGKVVGHLSSLWNNDAETHKPTPDYSLPGNEDKGGGFSSSLNAPMVNEEIVGQLSTPLKNAGRYKPLSGCAVIGNEKKVGHIMSRSLNNTDIPKCCSTGNSEMDDCLSGSVEAEGSRYVRDYTSINDVPDRNPLLGPNADAYRHAALDYTSRNDRKGGHLPYRSVSTINESLGSVRRRDEFRHAQPLKREEFYHSTEGEVGTSDYPKDAGRPPPPPACRSLENLRPPHPQPKVSFSTFEREMSRCENALREAKTELCQERKKQVVVDTFRMNLLEVDRMCSEELSRLRLEAARLEPLNNMAAEWDRDPRRAYWYEPYDRENQRSGGRDCFVKSYVRRLGDPKTFQAGEIRPPTV